MDKKLQDKLFEDFPILYQEHSLSMQETCMCWGFDCGRGWEPLIRELSEILEKFNRENPEIPIKATQVKEKYASLRFYVNSAPDPLWDLISTYEDRSEKICEECGKESSGPRGKGWIRTLCEDCWKEYENKE